jgi:RNA polymerase sigma factor (sigma-70 family)
VDRAACEPDRAGSASSERASAALALLAAHQRRLRRIAARISICPDDAEDALQRAVLILLTKAPPLEPERLIAWMTVVTKREAMAVRRSRERLLSPPRPETADGQLPDALETSPCELPGPAELAERRELVADAWAALAALKPQERLAIVLQAHGYSYAEICALCDWTYTKVNRCLAEGRGRLRALGASP